MLWPSCQHLSLDTTLTLIKRESLCLLNETSAKPCKTLFFSRGRMKIKFMDIISFCVLVGGAGGEGVCHKVICILSILYFL